LKKGRRQGSISRSIRGGTSKVEESWYKSEDQKVFAGVCSGLAHKFEVSVSALRVVTVLSSLVMGAPLFVYIGMWIFLPAKSTRS